MSEKQDELLILVKAMKRNSDAEYFDLGKCCHTVSSTYKYAHVWSHSLLLKLWKGNSF